MFYTVVIPHFDDLGFLFNIQKGTVWSDSSSFLTTTPLLQSLNQLKVLLTLLELFRAAKELMCSVVCFKIFQLSQSL